MKVEKGMADALWHRWVQSDCWIDGSTLGQKDGSEALCLLIDYTKLLEKEYLELKGRMEGLEK